MKVSFTCSFEKMFFDLDNIKILNKLASIQSKSKEKYNGFGTVEISLPNEPGTDEQNAVFHALIGEYWRFGASYLNYRHMRDSIKLRVSRPKEYIYISGSEQITVGSLKDIPKNSVYVKVPKSWTDFNKRERITAINDTIKEMLEAGVNTVKFNEIMEGMKK